MLLSVIFGLAVVGSVSAGCSYNKPSWTTENGNIKMNGANFHLKGINWFGFEDPDAKMIHGLWEVPLSSQINSLKALNINVVRLPFSEENVLNNPRGINCHKSSNICSGKSYMEILKYVVDELGKNGMLVMLDNHRVSGYGIDGLWKNGQYNEQQFLQSWDKVMDAFCSGGSCKWNVMALDLKNEPHGSASWGKNSPNDWNTMAEKTIKRINSKHPEFKGLFFVEGVETNAVGQDNLAHFWGGNMCGVKTKPINVGSLNNRVVYSPHVYGPDVHLQSYFKDGNFPNNMEHIWDTHFGLVEEWTGNPVVLGEWGGKFGHGPQGNKDKVWQDTLADYLIKNCMADQFYWCLNPNSGDTGGLLKDNWREIDSEKKRLLDRVQPNPSFLTERNGKYCYDEGAPPNPSCSSGTPSTGGGSGNSGKNDGNQGDSDNGGGNSGGSQGGSNNGGGSSGSIVVESWEKDNWGNGGNTEFKVKNNGGGKVCDVCLTIRNCNSGGWGYDGSSGCLKEWMSGSIGAGQSKGNGGCSHGSSKPIIKVKSYRKC